MRTSKWWEAFYRNGKKSTTGGVTKDDFIFGVSLFGFVFLLGVAGC